MDDAPAVIANSGRAFLNFSGDAENLTAFSQAHNSMRTYNP